jgi:DNA excision repair protein ERCC-6
MYEITDSEQHQSSFIHNIIENHRQQRLEQLEIQQSQLRIQAENGDRRASKRLERVRDSIRAIQKQAENEGNEENKEIEDYSRADHIKNEIVVEEDVVIEGELKIQARIWNRLFTHQKAAIEWMWELRKNSRGGILGDEMGMGKTIEILGYLEALTYSDILTGPVLLVCPATLVDQWLSEANIWAPSIEGVKYTNTHSKDLKSVISGKGVVVMSYELLLHRAKNISKYKWDYAILDEGHRIRNPDAQITKICKNLQASNKICISGTPIQNSLTELWCIFDFACPGLLGTLYIFDKEFASAIMKAGYTNASALQVETGYQCALQLRNLISPYFLRRTRKEAQLDLPSKEEKLLFCELTEGQYDAYKKFIEEWEVVRYKDKKAVFRAIKELRLICNHTAILPSCLRESLHISDSSSSKLDVLKQVLALWLEENHKVLIFSQYKKMLNCTEDMLDSMNIPYGRIDGDLAMKERLPLIDDFNTTGNLKVLILTTKVGGFGLNLPGASRVVILDPDWNPMNDTQAKERALRIGQTKEVVIYRFITKNTIEEKIYQRQIFKTYLANRV